MAWDHLSINKPHLVYIILGGFTSLFMLCSSFIKERLYIGEATVATICGLIFGPHAANLIDPSTWGNVDQITLEFSRIVLVVQCFAVGVELPKYYMEKHWRSVTLLLLPVMTFGWLVTSLFIWWMVPTLNWLESLVVASCVTATDPVLASSVVGKGKFAKRVPKHLRDLLSAESGCNDGMAFPFVYIGLYILHYDGNAHKVAFHWIVVTILYECVFGAIYGFTIGYIGRRGIRWAEKHELIDRESFLVFYFVLALFCAGSGSMLGVDDLLVGFAAGIGFSNDGWFTQKTEESHVSNVIDLLINLAYFVYFGTIVPWEQFNSPDLGTHAWRLVIIAIFVLFFRRIPIMLMLKPIIPDIKSWREALFAGHFGPIGVGAIFIAILARAELETGHTTPLAILPEEGTPHYHLIALIWPITTFLVITSIIVHGSSIAVFTLGKHINTLTLTMSYTTANEDGPSWMERLPRVASRSKSMSKQVDEDEMSMHNLPPNGMPSAFLRRQQEGEEDGERGRQSGILPRRRKKSHHRYGGPISQSAIAPLPRDSQATTVNQTPTEKRSMDSEGEESPLGEVQHDREMEEIMHHDDEKNARDQHKSDAERHPDEVEAFKEGDDVIFENEDGDVLDLQKSPMEDELMAPKANKAVKTQPVVSNEPAAGGKNPAKGYKDLRKKLGVWMHKDADLGPREAKPKRARGPALAYQFGNTIIVEDEDGEVVKKYELPKPDAASGAGPSSRPVLNRIGSLMGTASPQKSSSPAPVTAAATGSDPALVTSAAGAPPKDNSKLKAGINKWTGIDALKTLKTPSMDDPEDDAVVRFTMGGKRLTKADFLQEMKNMTPKERAKIVERSNAPDAIKEAARKDADPNVPGEGRLLAARNLEIGAGPGEAKAVGAAMAAQLGGDVTPPDGAEDSPVSSQTAREESSEEDVKGKGIAKQTPADLRRAQGSAIPRQPAGAASKVAPADDEEKETPAERRRRIAALGHSAEPDETGMSDDGEQPQIAERGRVKGIRFAEEPIRKK